MTSAYWNGALIAQSEHTITVEGNHYFPPDSVNQTYLRPSDARTHCAWKGDAQYYDIIVDGQRNEQAAWYYPQPLPDAQQISGYIAFWNGVTVQA